MAILAITAGLFALSFQGVLFSPGHISQNWDQTIPPFASQIRAYGSISADSWSAVFELGSPATFNGISWMFDQIMRHGLAFAGGPALAKWHFLAYVIVGAAGFALLARRLGLTFWPALAVCLLSQFGPRTYSLVVSGHGFETGFALMCLPWMVYLADKAVSARGFTRAAAVCGAGLAAGLASSTSPFGVVFTGVFLALWAAAAMLSGPWFKPLAVFGCVLAALVALHLHWMVPAAGAGVGGAKYNQRLEDVRAHYEQMYRRFSVPPGQAMIGHTDNLGMGTEYAYPIEGARAPWWKASAYALLGLALLGVFYRSRSPSLSRFAWAAFGLGFLMLAGAQTMAGRILYEAVLGRVQMVFYLMARPVRWLPVYQAGFALAAGMGLEAVRRRGFWTSRRWPDVLAVCLTLAALTVYLEPWWSGELTRPKNDTTQTMALTLQNITEDEKKLVAAVTDDPGDYRVTVFPTISGPTGNVPNPPATSLTRNFGFLGKDSLVGPAFVGQPYGRFLLSLAHRQALATDMYGRLLGLGAVKRLFFDTSAPYLAYMDFGWMPKTRRGAETLADPRGVLAPFLAAQRDLAPDPAWTFGPLAGLDNTDYLPRIRTVESVSLAAGGLPLLVAMAQLEGDALARQALFFTTDLSHKQAESLAALKPSVSVGNGAWPELLLPFAPASCWIPAWTGQAPPPAGFSPIKDRWHHALWFEGSPLNSAALWSQSAAELAVALPTAGLHRVYLRLASLPGQHGARVSLGGETLAETASFDPMDRAWRWLDLGWRTLDGATPLVVATGGRGLVVAGALCLDAKQYEAATAQAASITDQSGPARLVYQASACANSDASPYATVLNVPLLGVSPGLERRSSNLRAEGLDGSGVGVLAAEGDAAGQALFTLELPYQAAGFTLECYPRFYGDPDGKAFMTAEWSPDGAQFYPLFDLAPAPDGKWEDVYGRRVEVRVDAPVTKLWVRFRLRQAQLVSQGNAPNQPMQLTFSPRTPVPGAPAMGQGVCLPARFSPENVPAGRWAARARVLTPKGPVWRELGEHQTDQHGKMTLNMVRFGAAMGLEVCDLIELQRSGNAKGQSQEDQLNRRQAGFEAGATAPVVSRRVNQARYAVDGPLPPGGVLLLSESYHPRWQARFGGEAIAPLPAYGFMNAYLLGDTPSESLELVFAPQLVRQVWLTVSLAAWGLLVAGCVAFSVLGCYAARKKQATGRAEP